MDSQDPGEGSSRGTRKVEARIVEARIVEANQGDLTQGSRVSFRNMDSNHTRGLTNAGTNSNSGQSLDFLKSYNEFQVKGRHNLPVEPEELRDAINGLTNMRLAHEIAVNNSFRFEATHPPPDSLEARVREQMKRAYWDVFDEAVSSDPPNLAYALNVFRELKQMLLGLLMSHNTVMRQRIEDFLSESEIQYEIDHQIFEFSKYTDYIVECLSRLCCPIRDATIAKIKTLDRPSMILSEIMLLMEQMHLDMANYLVHQIRPTIIKSCVGYERKKFANFIWIQYKLNADGLRDTRAWLLPHMKENRNAPAVLGKAFAEVLRWDQARDCPETLALDEHRIIDLARETRRVILLAACILTAHSAARIVLKDDTINVPPSQYDDETTKDSLPLLRALREDLDRVVKIEDCETREKQKLAVQLLAEQAVKVYDDVVHDKFNRRLTDAEREAIRAPVRDCANDGNPIVEILLSRVENYAASIIEANKPDSIAFPQGLGLVDDLVGRIIVDLYRLAMHNHLVFEDLYGAIIAREINPPKLNKDGNPPREVDENVVLAVSLLSSEVADEMLNKNDPQDDIEFNLEIEKVIDAIMQNTEVLDSYDHFEILPENEGLELLRGSDARKHHLPKEADDKNAEAVKQNLREELRFQIKVEMGLSTSLEKNCQNRNQSPGMQKYCRLLRMLREEEAAEEEARQLCMKPSILNLKAPPEFQDEETETDAKWNPKQ